jgi:hypothetical protein
MAKASPTRGQLAVLVGLVSIVLLALLFVVAAERASVIRQGHLLDWAGGNVREVDLGGVGVYLSSEFRFRIDDVTTWVLISLGSVAALGASLVGFAAGRTWWMLTLSAAAGIWLGLDEGLALHETIGHNLGFLADLPGVRAPDDLIVAVYVVLAVAFAFGYRDLLARSRAALRLFAAGLAIAVLAAVLDLGSIISTRNEDVIETVAVLVLLAGYVTLVRELVRGELSTVAG